MVYFRREWRNLFIEIQTMQNRPDSSGITKLRWLKGSGGLVVRTDSRTFLCDEGINCSLLKIKTMKQYLIYLCSMIFSFLLIGCSEQAQGEKNPAPSNETPKIFQESTSYRDGIKSSIKKVTRYSLVEQLYQEAVEKDPALKALDTEILGMNALKQDSLNAYYKYFQNVQNYWGSANDYINKLEDSTLQVATRQYFDILENRHKERLDQHKTIEDSIEAKTNILYNQHLLVKLLTSSKMMENYQFNEFPSLKTLENVHQKYDELIDETHSQIIYKSNEN